MAGWISSKLKVAENLLQQIDQQAAESLGKADNPSRFAYAADLVSVEADYDGPPHSGESPISSAKFPLLKKSAPDLTKVSSTPPPSFSSTSAKPTPDPTFIDWTVLLSSPSPIVPATAPRPADGTSVPRPSPLRFDKKPAVSKKIPSLSSFSSPVFPSFKEDRNGENDDSRSRRLESSLLPGSEARNLGIGTDLNQSKQEGAEDIADDFQFNNVPANHSSRSDRDSDLDTSLSSGSDSEDEARRRNTEKRRKRKEHILAEKAARAAADAIKEKEDIVSRLEREKRSLEKMLEERERQQAKEASELQMSMIETMEAVELEKQKHNSTRMEALARLAELETQNAELAKSLAAEQWNLEVSLNRVEELKQQIGLKELAQEEHRRRLSTIKQKAASPAMMAHMRKDRVEIEILDAEYTFTCEKIARLKDKAEKLEENIEKTKREIMQPTEVEVELKKRLSQLTDRLIQKQTQVEALCSEKAALIFRLEKLLLNKNGLSREDGDLESLDVEAGEWKHSNYATKVALRERIRSGRRQLGLVICQLDAIFTAGALCLRRNTMGQLFSVIYLICLHLWALYILGSHSKVSDGAGHGAVFSLENISNNSGH